MLLLRWVPCWRRVRCDVLVACMYRGLVGVLLFAAVTIDRGAKQRIVRAGTATATEPTREHKQYAVCGSCSIAGLPFLTRVCLR